MPTKVEPPLQRVLESDAETDELIDVVFSFAAHEAQTASASMPLVKRREVRAAAMSKTIEQALARAGDIAGTKPTQVTPFPLTGSALVQAPRSYLRALLDQSEVAGAMLNTRRSEP